MNLLNLFNASNTYSNRALIGLFHTKQVVCAPKEAYIEEQNAHYCLIYSRKGSAVFHRQDQQGELKAFHKKAAILPADSLLFLSCEGGLRFRALDSGWEFWIFYLGGNPLSFYYNALSSHSEDFLPLGMDSPLLPSLRFLIQLKHSKNTEDELAVTSHVIHLLSEYLYRETPDLVVTPKTPSYLALIKEDFEQHYSRPFSLEDLAALHKVSKYQICRDFSKHYDLSPIKYLNQIRIQNACKLLLSGDLQINEVGSAVGIENTNHFIRLFKVQMNMTPLQYRRSMPTL